MLEPFSSFISCSKKTDHEKSPFNDKKTLDCRKTTDKKQWMNIFLHYIFCKHSGRLKNLREGSGIFKNQIRSQFFGKKGGDKFTFEFSSERKNLKVQKKDFNQNFVSETIILIMEYIECKHCFN